MKASSAAPMMTESPPSAGQHDLRLLGRRGERPVVQGVQHVVAHEREDPAQHAAEDDHLGVEDVHQPAEAEPERAAEGPERAGTG